MLPFASAMTPGTRVPKGVYDAGCSKRPSSKAARSVAT